MELAIEHHHRVDIASTDRLSGAIEDFRHLLYMAVVGSRRGEPRTLRLVDHADVDHLQHIMQNHRLYDHAFTRNDLHHLLEHQTVQSLMDGRPAETQQRRDRRLVDALAWLEFAGDDAILD